MMTFFIDFIKLILGSFCRTLKLTSSDMLKWFVIMPHVSVLLCHVKLNNPFSECKRPRTIPTNLIEHGGLESLSVFYGIEIFCILHDHKSIQFTSQMWIFGCLFLNLHKPIADK